MIIDLSGSQDYWLELVSRSLIGAGSQDYWLEWVS